MRRIALMLALVAWASVVLGQTTTLTVAWDESFPLATVTTWTHQVRVDGVVQQGTRTCAAHVEDSTKATCSLAIPVPAPGPHVVVIRATAPTGAAELTVTGWDPSKGPTPGSGFRWVMTTTIVSGS